MPDVRDRQQGCFSLGEWEKCLICVSGRLSVGLIRWTGYVYQYVNPLNIAYFNILVIILSSSDVLPLFLHSHHMSPSDDALTTFMIFGCFPSHPHQTISFTSLP